MVAAECKPQREEEDKTQMAEGPQFESIIEALEHLATRRTVRAYRREEKPPRHLVRLILKVAACAPYASHDDKPPWRFIATDDAKLIEAVADALEPVDSSRSDSSEPDFNPLTYFRNAPWVVVILSKLPDPEQAPDELREYIAYDMTVSYGTALGALMSAAHLAGLAAGWIGFFTAAPSRRADGVEKLLGVKAPWRVHAIVPIGYTAEKGVKRELDFDEIIEFR